MNITDKETRLVDKAIQHLNRATEFDREGRIGEALTEWRKAYVKFEEADHVRGFVAYHQTQNLVLRKIREAEEALAEMESDKWATMSNYEIQDVFYSLLNLGRPLTLEESEDLKRAEELMQHYGLD